MKRKGLIKCPHCGKWKPLTDYYITRQGYRSGWCKVCWCAREREYRKKYGYRHKKERITRGKDGVVHRDSYCMKCRSAKSLRYFYAHHEAILQRKRSNYTPHPINE